jgi:selenocysteine lyase/cysteine desulfurase
MKIVTFAHLPPHDLGSLALQLQPGGDIRFVVDVAAVAKLAHAAGAEIVLDCVPYAPHAIIDVQAFDCDYLICSGYKVFGPHMGFLWGRLELLTELSTFREDFIPDAPPGKIKAGTFIYENVTGMEAAVSYLETLGASLAREEENTTLVSRRDFLVRAMTAIRAYEATLSWEMFEFYRPPRPLCMASTTPPASLSAFLHFAPTFRTLRRRLSPRLCGIGIRDGHMYTPRLMKHLGISLDSGVIRSSLLYYNTVEEIHEFGNVLGDILRSQ